MATVTLTWTFEPADAFEESIEVKEADYTLAIDDGKAEAKIDTAAFDRDPAIRDALKKKFGSDAARTKVGVSNSEWSRFGLLANETPLRQGRHRGLNTSGLRDATEAELSEVRRIAKKMIEGYLGTL